MVKARQIVGILNNDQDTDSDLDPDSPVPDTTLPSLDVVAYRVQTRQSNYMDVFHGHRVVHVTIDSSATRNMICHSTAKRLGCPIISSAQSVQQADGSSQLQVVGEIRATFTRDNTDFTFEGLVVEDLDVEVLAGIPFKETNENCCATRKERGAPWQWLYLYIRVVELLYSMFLLPPKLFGPENSWKNGYQTTPSPAPSFRVCTQASH